MGLGSICLQEKAHLELTVESISPKKGRLLVGLKALAPTFQASLGRAKSLPQ